nr:S-layer homology domain-containing protein [uncultured Oscillibacter sp.]
MHIRLPKRLLAAALAGTLAMTPVSAAFTDTPDHWAADAIAKWSEEYQIIQGYEDGTFRPDNSITRGAFAGILDRFLKFQAQAPAEVFTDTAGTYWESAILKLNAAGIYLGNNGRALPSDTITRQQAVTMIARAFGVDAATETLSYLDAEQFADYARGPVAEMTARGYITDSQDGSFRPLDPITRAEIVSILNNMIQVLVQETAEYAADVSGTMMINAEGGASLRDMTIAGDLILAPGISGPVTLNNVTIQGALRNFSGVEPTWFQVVPTDPQQPGEPQTPETPAGPGIQPSEVYTPGVTTGETFEYDKRQIPVYADAEPIQLYEGDFVWNDTGDRLIYTGNRYRTRFGVDVSAYQNRASETKTIDWQAARDDGVEFAMVRIGFRGTSTGAINADEYYAQNIDGAMAAGIETGVYFFAQAITVEEAIEEADFVIELLRDHEINGPVAYDWEMHNSSYRVYGTAPEMATACAIAFCKRIQEAGYTPMIYAGTYVSYIKYDQGAIAPYLSWYPEYKSASSEKLYPTIRYQMDYWQFTSSCTVAGISGRVDANLQFIPW